MMCYEIYGQEMEKSFLGAVYTGHILVFDKANETEHSSFLRCVFITGFEFGMLS